MANLRDHEWETNQETYSPSQVEAVLEKCGVEVETETPTHFVGYCPFHNNTDSPAFAADMYNGKWTCFNPTCLESGNLEDLLRRLKKMNPFQIAMFLAKSQGSDKVSVEDRVKKALETPVEFVPFPQATLDRLKEQFWANPEGHDYMAGRGFTDETLDYFDVGYSLPTEKKPFSLVTVPMHDPKGTPIGLIGRTPSHEEKTFKNSYKLPKTKTAWNFHRAKVTGDTVIVCEASYDAMRIHQAGYPNVVALLGGHVSAHHIDQLDRTFSKFIIMTDYDKKLYRPNCKPCNYRPCTGHRPGRDLGRSLINKLPGKNFLWAAYDDTCVFPHDAKDASDMTDNEIRKTLKNSVSNLAYSMWNIEEKDAA